MKLKTQLLKNAGLIKGIVIEVNTFPVPAPTSWAASSILGSIWRREEILDLTPTGNLVITRIITKIESVLVSTKGFELKLKTYPRPNTTPGTAIPNREANSMNALPLNFFLTIRNATRTERTLQKNATRSATIRVSLIGFPARERTFSK